MEKIDAVVLGPKWQPVYTTCIASNNEEAINEAETDGADVKVFTDGSCRDGHVGAAAVLYRGGTENQVVKLYMGTENEHTVFKAELAAAARGSKLLNMELDTRFTIALDNQAAIQTTRREKMISGQYLVNALHHQADGITRFTPGKNITLRWVSGNKGVAGNKRADEEAKAAAAGGATSE